MNITQESVNKLIFINFYLYNFRPDKYTPTSKPDKEKKKYAPIRAGQQPDFFDPNPFLESDPKPPYKKMKEVYLGKIGPKFRPSSPAKWVRNLKLKFLFCIGEPIRTFRQVIVIDISQVNNYHNRTRIIITNLFSVYDSVKIFRQLCFNLPFFYYGV